ncbi:HAD family hydrolase [Methanobacterium sp. ACI-7]|uniref:HAD family hydrolase n=1 Tax=unclassified Methanobacterium TaxID=2627676 RepID=UPI0039C26825
MFPINRLVLFDVDRTLIGRSQCHHDAFSYAFKKVYDADVDIRIINYGGMTDPAIAIEVLKKIGLKEDIIIPKLSQCMDEIVKYFQKNVERDTIPILAGVNDLLELLTNNGTLLGLVTGNLEPIAWGKLKKIGIDHYFKLGGFGSDNINRTELVKTGIKKAKNNYNFNGTTFVIGDTPRDIKAGFEANAKTIAVATGTYTVEELKEFSPDFVFEDLREKKEILKVIMQH